MTTHVIRLTKAWNKIQRGLAMEDEGRKLWINGTMELALVLAEARRDYPSNIEFGVWLTGKGFGKDIINEHDRTALVEMGKHPHTTQDVLNKTQRRSWQLIWREEIEPRFASVSKTPQRSHNEPQQEPSPVVEQVDPKPKISRHEQSDWKARLEEVYKLKCAKFRAQVEKEYRKKFEEAEKVKVRALYRLASPHGLISKEDDRLIMKALHPDHVAALGEETIKLHNEAVKAYSKYRDIILKKPAEPLDPKYDNFQFF